MCSAETGCFAFLFACKGCCVFVFASCDHVITSLSPAQCADVLAPSDIAVALRLVLVSSSAACQRLVVSLV